MKPSPVGRAVNEFLAKDTFEMGAALAYYTVFSLAPLTLLILAIVAAIAGLRLTL